MQTNAETFRIIHTTT